MHMDALVEYVRLQGASQKTSVNSWDKIWSINKRVIDPLSARLSAVPLADAVVCTVANREGPEEVRVARHKKNAGLGEKTVFRADEILLSQEDALVLEIGEEFTLMGWGNAVVESKAVENGVVRGARLRLNLAGDFKTTKNKLTWISRKGAMLVKFYEYGSLQNDVVSEDLAEQFNKDSKKEEWWLADNAVNEVAAGDFVQFERIGFFICDKKMEFNLVPFTRQKRVH